MEENFLLDTEAAKRLYEIAKKLPIIDYHCHLSPREIAEDKPFGGITPLWLGGDHYKWRAMRANGVPERNITGDASDAEKFAAWAATVPATLRNPLFDWTRMELATAFGIDTILTPETADEIYEQCNKRLTEPDMTPRGLMRRYGVEVVCTTDDPADDLRYHRRIADDGFEVKVLPTWRPDKAIAFESAPEVYKAYIATLSAAAGIEIVDFDTLIEALQRRHDFFNESGCRLADHGLSDIPFAHCTREEANALTRKILGGEALTVAEAEKAKTAALLELCRMNARDGWAQQFHFGPLRNVNSRAWNTLGADSGFDTIGPVTDARKMAALLDALDRDGLLAKSILYNLNPADNAWVAAMIANFQDGSVSGKMQMGSGWWFNDNIAGMEAQMNALSNQGLLSRFVGMLTDSRSFLSYPRHDYFRRVLCRLLGRDIEAGLIPESMMPQVEKMVADICYYNAKNYFNF